MSNAIPRLLIISINALRMDGSNGKVLSELLINYPDNKIAQFYLHEELPDFKVCHNYFKISDHDALVAFLKGTKPTGEVAINDSSNKTTNGRVQFQSHLYKNSLTLLIRDMVWNSRRWESKAFWKWIEDFSPEVVLVQAGASSHLHNIAVRVADRCKAPLVILNTENYYLKQYNYLKGKGWDFVFPVFKWESDRAFQKMMARASKEIYTNDVLDVLYEEAFHRHGEVIYQGSAVPPVVYEPHTPPVISYAGGLGIDRHLALIEVAKALYEISPDYHLDVYGKAPDSDVEKQLRQAKGLRYHGLVSYEKVLSLLKESDFMVHAESFDPFWIRDLKTAFTTKISDIMKAGQCLILYADESLACSQYVKRNDCGCLISSPEKLKESLQNIFNNKDLQVHFRQKALEVAARDMDGKKNSQRFKEIITSVFSK